MSFAENDEWISLRQAIDCYLNHRPPVREDVYFHKHTVPLPNNPERLFDFIKLMISQKLVVRGRWGLLGYRSTGESENRETTSNAFRAGQKYWQDTLTPYVASTISKDDYFIWEDNVLIKWSQANETSKRFEGLQPYPENLAPEHRHLIETVPAIFDLQASHQSFLEVMGLTPESLKPVKSGPKPFVFDTEAIRNHLEKRLNDQRLFIWKTQEELFHELGKIGWSKKPPSLPTFYRNREALPFWPRILERVGRKINLKPM